MSRIKLIHQRQLQLRIGTAEVHFTETPRPAIVGSAHFAVEVDDWEGHACSPRAARHSTHAAVRREHRTDVSGTAPDQGRREDSGEHFTYIHDPDGNMIELVYQPLGMEDGHGNKVEPAPEAEGLRWVQMPGFIAAAHHDAGVAR